MIICREATMIDAEELAPRLSHLDVQEIAAYSPDVDPEDALKGGVTGSRDCMVLLVDGRPVAMWGITELICNDTDTECGAPWLLSAGAEAYTLSSTRALLRECKKSIAKWHT